MFARLVVLSLAVGIVALVAPSPLSPVGHASAVCIEASVDDCANPCNDIVAVYNVARETAGVEDKTPDLFCLQ